MPSPGIISAWSPDRPASTASPRLVSPTLSALNCFGSTRVNEGSPKSGIPWEVSSLGKLPTFRPDSLAKVAFDLQERASGEMAEWLKAHAWKACVRETVPWVRIPLSPPRWYPLTSTHVHLRTQKCL